MIQHVYEQVMCASTVDVVAVATDDDRIMDAVQAFGGLAVMTSSDHQSGTDRIAEAVKTVGGDIIINVQGDEPMIEPEEIDDVVRLLLENDHLACATAASPIEDDEMYRDTNAVKVVLTAGGEALYFSRAPIPHYRDGVFGGAYLHHGLYCFRRSHLDRFTTLKPTPLETAERLEQLRMLEHGWRIGVVVRKSRTIGVDTPADLDRVKKMLKL